MAMLRQQPNLIKYVKLKVNWQKVNTIVHQKMFTDKTNNSAQHFIQTFFSDIVS